MKKKNFMCSLCHKGILGGWMIVDEKTLNYRTGKITVDSKYRNLVLNRDDILTVSWKWVVFPKAVFEMKNGERYTFLIFNKHGFMKVYES